MSTIFTRLKARLCAPDSREFFAWMLPALLVGAALRVVLMIHLPYGYYHDDAPDFLATPDDLLHQHEFKLHQKKTFLVPIIFTVPFLVRIPALIAIPVFQHLLGLALIVLVGLLCRLWFRHWRLFIVPLTVLTAANPSILWYEHTLMAETIFLVTTALVALAGTLYTLEQSRGRFVFLLVALFLEAGARPEGKLLFGFGICLVVLLHWRDFRLYWPRVALLLALAIATHFITKTAQAGLLLYTSVARMTPSEAACAPGFDPYIESIRADLQMRWERGPIFPSVRDRREISAAVTRYLEAADPKRDRKRIRRDVDDLCARLAMETCAKNLAALPMHVLQKFRRAATETPSGRLDAFWLFERQTEGYQGTSERSLRLARGLTGQTITSNDGLKQFVDTHYRVVPWFNTLQDRWFRIVNARHFPDRKIWDPSSPTGESTFPGIPFYFLAAALGIVAIAVRRGTLQPFHIAWGLTLFGFFFAIILTANIRPRFRFVFEIYWFLYLALLAEGAWLAIHRLFLRRA